MRFHYKSIVFCQNKFIVFGNRKFIMRQKTTFRAKPVLTRLLRGKGLKAAEIEKGLETIDRSIHLQTRLIDDLLDVSRIMGGKLTLERSLIDFRAITDSVIEGERNLAVEKNIKFDHVVDSGSYQMQGDADRLRQVVFNVVGNALKFTPSYGAVRTQLSKEDGKLTLTVCDNGIGILPESIPHLFDWFRFSNFAASREHKGLGVGLNVAGHLVAAHGGTIEAASGGRDKGVTFVIRLPAINTEGS